VQPAGRVAALLSADFDGEAASMRWRSSKRARRCSFRAAPPGGAFAAALRLPTGAGRGARRPRRRRRPEAVAALASGGIVVLRTCYLKARLGAPASRSLAAEIRMISALWAFDSGHGLANSDDST